MLHTNSHPHWSAQLQGSLSSWHHAINHKWYKANCRTSPRTASTPACPSVFLGFYKHQVSAHHSGLGRRHPHWPGPDGQQKKKDHRLYPPCMQQSHTWSVSTHYLLVILGLEKPQNGDVCWSEAALGGPSPALEGNQLKRAVSDETKARQSTYSCFQANM